MKKWLAFVLAAVLLLTMVACGKKDDPQPTDGKREETVDRQETTETIVETQKVVEEEWGVSDQMDIFPVRLNFSWPHSTGYTIIFAIKSILQISR